MFVSEDLMQSPLFVLAGLQCQGLHVKVFNREASAQ